MTKAIRKVIAKILMVKSRKLSVEEALSLEDLDGVNILSLITDVQGTKGLTREIRLEKVMASHSSTLACKIPRTEEPGRLQSMQ